MKKAITVLTLLLLATALFSQGAAEPSATATETKIFVDDLGREVLVDANLTRVAPSGTMAQVLMLTYDPSLLSGVSVNLNASQASLYPKEVSALPIYGTFYGKKANLNKEALIVSDPQVIIDVGEIKGSISSMIDDLDKLQEQTGIPVVFIESYLKNTATTYKRIGELLGAEERASILSAYAEDAIEFASYVSSNVTAKRRFYYSSSNDGLEGIPATSFHGEVLELVGGENVIDASFSSGSNQVSLELILMEDPEVIFVSTREAYELITAPDGPWSTITAVENGEVYIIPNIGYSWIDSPPSVNRLIGIYYAANILYPEVADIDIEAKAKEYYKLFFNYDL